MSDTTLTIRTDSTTKKAISDFAASLGLSKSAFITAATLQAVREGQLTLTPLLEPTPYLEKIMLEVEENIKSKTETLRIQILRKKQYLI